MNLKAEQIERISHPPLHLPLRSGSSTEILSAVGPNRFDVILINPSGTWDETASLPIRNISADPGFVFLWVGRGDQDGLEKGRECLAKWGFRRAEDIVWVKPTQGRSTIEGNENGKRNFGASTGGLLASLKEHCLMGIRGTVRRSTDGHFAHCNVDTDVMIWSPEEGESARLSLYPPHRSDAPDGSQERFPPYLYTLIESFCLGTRRLQLSPHVRSSPRRGWVTASTLPFPAGSMAFDPDTYPSMLPPKQDGRDVLPFDGEIDHLRPKSPVRNNRRNPPPQNAPQANQHQAPRPGVRGPPRPPPPFTPDSHPFIQPTFPGSSYGPQQQYQKPFQQPPFHSPRMALHPQHFGQMVYNPPLDMMPYAQMSGHQSLTHRPQHTPHMSPSQSSQHSSGMPSSPAQFYDPQMLYMMNQLQHSHLDPPFHHSYDTQHTYDNGGGHVENGIWYPPIVPSGHGQPGNSSWQNRQYH